MESNGISIVIPTHNRPDMLMNLLISISKQTFQNFEVIVIDDCSSKKEEYADVLERSIKIVHNINYFRNERNMGAPYSRNRGIKLAKFDWIALVDDDDDWISTKLEKQFSLTKVSNNKLGIIYTWTDMINSKKEVLFKYRAEFEGRCLSRIINDSFIPSPSVLVRKTALIKSGFFDEKLPSCQDWDMWLRIIKKGYTCAVVRSVESLYHKHDNDSIGKSPLASQGYKMFYKKHFVLIVTSFFLRLKFKKVFYVFKVVFKK